MLWQVVMISSENVPVLLLMSAWQCLTTNYMLESSIYRESVLSGNHLWLYQIVFSCWYPLLYLIITSPICTSSVVDTLTNPSSHSRQHIRFKNKKRILDAFNTNQAQSFQVGVTFFSEVGYRQMIIVIAHTPCLREQNQ